MLAKVRVISVSRIGVECSMHASTSSSMSQCDSLVRGVPYRIQDFVATSLNFPPSHLLTSWKWYLSNMKRGLNPLNLQFFKGGVRKETFISKSLSLPEKDMPCWHVGPPPFPCLCAAGDFTPDILPNTTVRPAVPMVVSREHKDRMPNCCERWFQWMWWMEVCGWRDTYTKKLAKQFGTSWFTVFGRTFVVVWDSRWDSEVYKDLVNRWVEKLPRSWRRCTSHSVAKKSLNEKILGNGNRYNFQNLSDDLCNKKGQPFLECHGFRESPGNSWRVAD